MNDYYFKRIPREQNEMKKALTWFTQHYGSPDKKQRRKPVF